MFNKKIIICLFIRFFNAPIFSFFQMADNPWHVDSIQEFLVFKCPECTFDSKEDYQFQNHATENHPLSFVLFGKKEVDKEENYNDVIKEEYKEYTEN